MPSATPALAAAHPFDDHTAADVVAWMEPVDAEARDWLARQPAEGWFRRRVTALLSHDTVLAVAIHGDSRYELRRPAGETHASIFAVTPTGTRRLIDASGLSPDGTVAITSLQLNPTGTVLAWSTIDSGADWATVRFLHLQSREALPESLTGLKATQLAWTGPETFAYLHFPTPPPGKELLAPNGGTSIRLHTLGTPQEQDQELLARDSATWMFPTATEDGRRLVVEEAVGIVPARLHVLDLTTRSISTVVDGEGPTTAVGIRGEELVVVTSVGAPGGRVEAISLVDGRRRTIVTESATPLEAYDTQLVGSTVYTVRHQLERSIIEAHPLDGRRGHAVDLPTGAFVSGTDKAGSGDSRLLVTLQLPMGPEAILVHDSQNGQTSEVVRWGDRGELAVRSELVWATSADGTRVPMRVHRPAGMPRDAKAPVLLLTYGGYGQHFLATGYQPWQRAWIDAGGVLAHAGIRGGGELGAEWHTAATTVHKQRGVDDLIACASWFTGQGRAAAGVVLNGMSNGGLLVAAAMTQRPELFAGVVPEVAVLDLLRFHLFTAGHGWVREFGDVDDPEQRSALAACSPLHALREGQAYPSTLLLTADRDDRVPPGPHSYAFYHRLRQVQAGDAPVLMRVSRNAGHFSGRSLAEQIDERTAVLTFAASALRLAAPTVDPTITSKENA